MPARPLPDRFKVAFSFAGEQRELVHAVAGAVEARLGVGSVFYDGCGLLRAADLRRAGAPARRRPRSQ